MFERDIHRRRIWTSSTKPGGRPVSATVMEKRRGILCLHLLDVDDERS
ncbi:hypothetical protein OKW49_005299 [Paraburkholderia youngii]